MVINLSGRVLLFTAFLTHFLFAGCRSAAENPSVLFLTDVQSWEDVVQTDFPLKENVSETEAAAEETDVFVGEDTHSPDQDVQDIPTPDLFEEEVEAVIQHCESDEECEPLVCDLESGECVECLEHEDCGAGKFCHANQCEEQVCKPLEFFCEGIEIRQCDGIGSGSEFVLTCDDNTGCTVDTCTDDGCVNTPSSPDCCVPECGEGLECKDYQCVCKPDCSGKECGGDGCGGSCGECKKQYKCGNDKCVFDCPLCPYLPGCYMDDWSGHAYYLCYDYKNWKASEGECEEFGAHLVAINSQAENSFLKAFAANNNVWIGLYESWWEWHWVTEEPVSFKNWAPGEPNDGDFWTTEDCGMMYPGGMWNDEECWTDLMFICEFEP